MSGPKEGGKPEALPSQLSVGLVGEPPWAARAREEWVGVRDGGAAVNWSVGKIAGSVILPAIQRWT